MTIERRPFSARGLIASTLLGTQPPLLSARRLSRIGVLFGIPAGTIRVALSRMTAAGELTKEDRGYRLTGPLLERQERQESGRRAETTPFDGQWEFAIVTTVGRDPRARRELRRSMRTLRLAELREGVWTRPANLVADRHETVRATVAEHCEFLLGRPETPSADLAARLWDLDEWARDAHELESSIKALEARLRVGDPDVIADGFVESAAVLRLLADDPMLPDELTPVDWPARSLRERYDRFDLAHRRLLRDWLDAT